MKRWPVAVLVTIAVLVVLNVFLLWRLGQVVRQPPPTGTPTATITPLAETAMPTATPRARRPGSCDQAREWGMDAVQAGTWDHLDRDNDGVACYGD